MSRLNADLLKHADAGDIVECATLLDAGLADIDCKDANHHTPLLLALKAEKEAAALYFIERGARLDVTAVDGWGPMHRAAWNGLDGAVCALHVRGVQVNVEGLNDGALPISLAVMAVRESTVRLLSSLGADPKAVYDDEGDGLLHLSARTPLSMLDALADLGLDLNGSNKIGLAPLHSMALLGKTGHVLKMLDWGADPLKVVGEQSEHAGKSAAEVADAASHPDTAAALRAWVANKEARKTLSEIGLSP